MKTIRGLVNELIKREGLKKQVEIAQVREVVGHLCDLVLDKNHVWDLLMANAIKRSKKK